MADSEHMSSSSCKHNSLGKMDNACTPHGLNFIDSGYTSLSRHPSQLEAQRARTEADVSSLCDSVSLSASSKGGHDTPTVAHIDDIQLLSAQSSLPDLTNKQTTNALLFRKSSYKFVQSSSSLPSDRGKSMSSLPSDRGKSMSSLPSDRGKSMSSLPSDKGKSMSSLPSDKGKSMSSLPSHKVKSMSTPVSKQLQYSPLTTSSKISTEPQLKLDVTKTSLKGQYSSDDWSTALSSNDRPPTPSPLKFKRVNFANVGLVKTRDVPTVSSRLDGYSIAAPYTVPYPIERQSGLSAAGPKSKLSSWMPLFPASSKALENGHFGTDFQQAKDIPSQEWNFLPRKVSNNVPVHVEPHESFLMQEYLERTPELIHQRLNQAGFVSTEELEEIQLSLIGLRYFAQNWNDEDHYFMADPRLFNRSMFPMTDEELLEYNLGFEILNNSKDKVNEVPAYGQGKEVCTECVVCCETVLLHLRKCCQFAACDVCIKKFLELKINEGQVKIQCIGTECYEFMYRDEILAHLSVAMKDKYYRYLVDANQDPKVKTCPRCSHVYEITDSDAERKTKYGLLVVCTVCKLHWCFECQAPWHFGLKCKDYIKGDKLLKLWAKEKHYGNNNAQKCPKCKVFIERKGGCDHMTCSKCDTSFCYKCGGRYIDLKFFGNHLSKYSPFGCKYNFKPDSPFTRRFVRGSVLGAKLLGGLVLLGLSAAAVSILLGTSIVILPAIGGFKYHKHRKIQRRLKHRQEMIKMHSANATMKLYGQRAAQQESRRVQIDDPVLANNDAIHIGVQTGYSQQVDVTVHNPYHPDALFNPGEPSDSGIQFNITDVHGMIMVTTAEVSHNSNDKDKSEAEVVLNVKTCYPKDRPVTDILLNENPKVMEEAKAGKEYSDLKIEGNLKNGESGQPVEIDVHNVSDTLLFDKQQRDSNIHRRVHSTGSLKKLGSKKPEFGSVSRKSKKSTSFTVSETGSIHSPNNIDLNLKSSSKSEGTERHQDDFVNNTECDAINQSGCFLKLFSKKFNTLQNSLEKENQTAIKQDLKSEISLDCPDIVNCALEAECKIKNGDMEKIETNENLLQKDSYFCLVANETTTTSF